MESSTHLQQTEEQKQAEIRRQISLLQAQLKEPVDVAKISGPSTPKKRKNGGHTVLAAGTPSPSTYSVYWSCMTRNISPREEEIRS